MKTALAFPKIGAAVCGGIFASIVTDKRGEPYALIKLEAQPGCHPLPNFDDSPNGFLTWEQAKAWAESLEGDLPTRAEAELLRSNVRAVLPDETWTCEENARDPRESWVTIFDSEDVTTSRKDGHAEALAIRRVPLDVFMATVIEPTARPTRRSPSAAPASLIAEAA